MVVPLGDVFSRMPERPYVYMLDSTCGACPPSCLSSAIRPNRWVAVEAGKWCYLISNVIS